MLQLIPRLLQPREVCLKRGSAARLRYLDARRIALIAGGRALSAAGQLDKLANFAKASKAEVAVLDGVTGEPTEAGARELSLRLAEFAPDWIVAAGGGAVLDSAKLAWAWYEQPELTLERLLTPFAVQGLRVHARFVAIPTTAGSGAEASSAAVITEAETGRKRPALSADFLPDVVVLDPTFTLSQPPAVTAGSALDAFSHALESYCSLLANPFAEALAIAAGSVIREQLPRVLAEPQNLDARERLLYASFQAGQAQNLVSVGAIHALSHTLGGPAGLAHGVCNALLLPAVVRFNAAGSPRPGEFAARAGFGSVDELCDWTLEQRAAAGLPQRLTLPESVNLETLAAVAAQDVCLRTNPRPATAADLAGLIRAAGEP